MNKEKIKNVLIGILLLLPLFIPIAMLTSKVDASLLNSVIYMTVLLYLPSLIGFLLYKKFYGDKLTSINTRWYILVIILSVGFYILTYVTDDILDVDLYFTFFLWIISLVALEIVSFLMYRKIVGNKKAIIYIVIYLAIILAAVYFGFFR